MRTGAQVHREHHAGLDEALAAVERIGRDLADGASARPAGGTLIRRIEPVHQVIGRIEVSGPGRVRVGVDLRGDGSTEAFTGRVRRKVVEQRRRESPYEALRRVIA